MANAEAQRKREEALRLFAEAAQMESADPGPTVSELAAAYVSERRPFLSQRELCTVECVLRPVLKHLGGVRVSELTRSVLRDYISTRQGETTVRKSPPSPRTINAEVTRLMVVVNWAVESRRVVANPVRRCPRLPISKLRRPDWGERELRAILRRCEVDWFRILTLTRWETGMRPTEAVALRRDQVSLEHGVIRFADGETKNGHGRTIPLTPRLERILREWIAALDPGEKYVFPKRGGGGHYHENYCSQIWRELIAISGVDPQGCPVTWHSVRAIYNTCARRRGIDLAERCYVLGHTSLDAHDDYEGISDLDLQRTAVRLELGAIQEAGRRPAKSSIERKLLTSLRRRRRAMKR